MFLAEPPQTQFDLHFSLFGIPVRVHPLFWLMGVILGAAGGLGEHAGVLILIWVAVVFVSILVHEFGHAFAMRRFGEQPRVVLYLMGGLAIADSGGFGVSASRSRSSRINIIISAAGPFAGFALAALVIAVIFATGGHVSFPFDHVIFWDFSLSVTYDPDAPNSIYLYSLVNSLLWVNIFWGLVNLLPVYPLDGGQIAREVMVGKNPWDGLRKSLILSIATGAAVAVLGLVLFERNGIFVAFMFGSLAFSSWQVLQQISGRGGGFGGGGGRPW